MTTSRAKPLYLPFFALSSSAFLQGSGEKIFITSGALALEESNGFCVVWATVDPNAGRKGIKSFVVEAHTPGVSVSPGLDKLGIRASDTVVLSFQDVRVPYDNLLGSAEVKEADTSKGFQGAMRTFDASRPIVAASADGIARAALETTREKLAEAGIEIPFPQRDVYLKITPEDAQSLRDILKN